MTTPKDPNSLNRDREIKYKWLEDLLFAVAEDGSKYHQGKLLAKNEVMGREVALEIIVERMGWFAKDYMSKVLHKTKLRQFEIKKLSESKESRDRHHFYLGWKKAREIIDDNKNL